MMKIKLKALGVGLAIGTTLFAATPPLPPQPITLVWNGSPDADGYELRSSPDLSTSYTNWPVLAYVAGGNTTNFSFVMTPSKMFFVCIASNFWGYGQPSNTTNTPNVTTPVTGLAPKR